MALASAIVGAQRPSQDVTWLREDDTPEDLTSATLTGTVIPRSTRIPQAIQGTLSVIDALNGIFRWEYALVDLVAGYNDVTFEAAFPTGPSPAKTFKTVWFVEE